MNMERRAHPSADEMELYVLGRLSSEHTAAVEEHLLVCEACQSLCDETQEFVSATRKAARALDATSDARSRSWWRAPFPAAAYACALTALVAVASVGYMRHTAVPDGDTVVALRATRSAETASPAASAGRSVRLKLDTSSLPSASRYLVEVADQGGDKVWTGEFAGNAATQEVRLNKALRAGTYWVRINAPDGTELREYELPVR